MGGVAKNLANILTLVRVVLTLFLCFFLMRFYGNVIFPLGIFLAIFVTDLLDGKIARFYGITSHFGAVFDVCADMFYIVVSYVLLCGFHIIPVWFFMVVIIKFIEFSITSHYIKKFTLQQAAFIFDHIGRFVAVLFYLVPAVTYVSYHCSKPLYSLTVDGLLWIVTLLALVSALYRITKLTRGISHTADV